MQFLNEVNNTVQFKKRNAIKKGTKKRKIENISRFKEINEICKYNSLRDQSLIHWIRIESISHSSIFLLKIVTDFIGIERLPFTRDTVVAILNQCEKFYLYFRLYYLYTLIFLHNKYRVSIKFYFSHSIFEKYSALVFLYMLFYLRIILK